MMSVTIEIDGKQVQAKEGMNLLEAALQNGVYIPHLCHHPDLPDIGSCRLCIVEVEGMEGVKPSCKLTVKDGMKVVTHSEKIDPLRKLAMELLLAAHPGRLLYLPKVWPVRIADPDSVHGGFGYPYEYPGERIPTK